MAKQNINKTNAARLLDRAKIAYELIPYEVDESLAATHVAEELGEPIEQVFKTLVLKGDRAGHFVCVIIPMKELLPTTGYIRGGCTPIGMKKPFPTFIDESCLAFDYIYISAGQRGLQLRLSPTDLIAYTQAKTDKLTL